MSDPPPKAVDLDLQEAWPIEAGAAGGLALAAWEHLLVMSDVVHSIADVTVYRGDCSEVMSGLAPWSIDMVITDSPTGSL